MLLLILPMPLHRQLLLQHFTFLLLDLFITHKPLRILLVNALLYQGRPDLLDVGVVLGRALVVVCSEVLGVGFRVVFFDLAGVELV